MDKHLENMTHPLRLALEVKENLLNFGSSWEQTFHILDKFSFGRNAM